MVARFATAHGPDRAEAAVAAWESEAERRGAVPGAVDLGRDGDAWLARKVSAGSQSGDAIARPLLPPRASAPIDQPLADEATKRPLVVSPAWSLEATHGMCR